MVTVTDKQVLSELTELLQRVAGGETIVIEKDGHPSRNSQRTRCRTAAAR